MVRLPSKTFREMRTFPHSGRVPRAVIRAAGAGALPGTGTVNRVDAYREAPAEPLAIILTAAHINSIYGGAHNASDRTDS